jgi:adenylate kinase
MVRERISRPDCAEGVIFDGFPRTTAQAAALDELLADLGARINIVPHIHVSHEALVQRLLKRAEIEGRADDNEETIRRRMRVYEDQTQPLLDYYEARELLVEIDGQQSIEDVFDSLLSAVEKAS